MIVIVMGVSGAGKSLIGKMLAHELGWTFFDADDYHPAANIEKMKRGIPLTEHERIPWLRNLARLTEDLHRNYQPAVVACSALRQSHRQIVAGNAGEVRFVYLKGDYEVIQQRVRQRRDHFMHPGLLRSQFELLEEPEDAVTVNVEQAADVTVSRIRQALGL